MRPVTFVFALMILSLGSLSQTVNNLNGFYRDGQVFLTWKNLSTDAYYKVYRSTSIITTSNQLDSSEYLGWVDKHSAEDHNLTTHATKIAYLHIDSNAASLAQGTGLFVATTLMNSKYYYAVTSLLNGTENKTILAGSNSLLYAIDEFVSPPQPVFQEQHLVGNEFVDVYTTFFSMKREIDKPLESTAGFIPLDFAVNRNYTGTGRHPMLVLFHGGGEDLFWNMQLDHNNETIKLGLEERLPSEENNGWIGSNENYDIFKVNTSNTIPNSGINYNYAQQVISQIIDWVSEHLPVDSNRIYISGTSLGAGGGFLYAITNPEKIAAVRLSVPCFNYSFQNDYNPKCSLNPGNQNRNDADVQFGKVSTNLMSNLGIHFYDAVNGGWMIHLYREKDYPIFFSINGKNDVMVGWTEKTIFYDSVKANHIGGYYFWDERAHGGANATWNDESFDLFRYSRNQSFPAFAYCSNDENYGIGDTTTGEKYGTINGSLDWNEKSIVDEPDKWEVKLFVRDLKTARNTILIYPDSCTVDVTPRRLQKFNVHVGATITWTVTHKNMVVQSGNQTYSGGLLTLSNVRVFKDTSILKISFNASTNVYYYDKDKDGYGNPQKPIEASIPPPGYVDDSSDCSDKDSSIHPGAADLCNNTDDNCDGHIDENAIIATVTPSGNISVCKDVTLTFTANSGNQINYQWNKNSKAIYGATDSIYIPSKTAVYSVIESNGFKCTSSSDPISVIIFDLPEATITPLGNLDICQTGSVELHANVETGLTYQWMKGATNITGGTNQIYTASTKGSYKVAVTSPNSCTKISKAVKVTKSCKENPSALVDKSGFFNLYPNPSSGTFTVHLKLNESRTSSAIIEIFNAYTQQIYSEKATIANGELKSIIGATPYLPNGVYVVRVVSGDLTFSERMIIER